MLEDIRVEGLDESSYDRGWPHFRAVGGASRRIGAVSTAESWILGSIPMLGMVIEWYCSIVMIGAGRIHLP